MTIQEFQNITEAKKAEFQQLSELTSESKVSTWRLIVYIVAFVANTLWQLFVLNKKEIENLINDQRVTGLDYYREKLLAREGIDRASVQIVNRDGRLILFAKVAKVDESGKLVKITDSLETIEQYMYPFTSAGTNIEYFSSHADQLRLTIDVYIDPLKLNTDGTPANGLGEQQPIPKVVKDFFASEDFPFNGEFRMSALTDVIQAVDGVKDRSVRIQSAQYNVNQLQPDWQPINESYIAKAGYFEIIDENLTINYLAKYAVQ